MGVMLRCPQTFGLIMYLIEQARKSSSNHRKGTLLVKILPDSLLSVFKYKQVNVNVIRRYFRSVKQISDRCYIMRAVIV